MKELIEHIARELVDEPDKVSVKETVDGTLTTYQLYVADDDLGKVIGRRGRTASAIRSLLAASGAKTNTRAVLQIES